MHGLAPSKDQESDGSELAIAAPHSLLQRFNDTHRAYPLDATIHGLFETQAQRRANEMAVICGERRMSYAELNARANQIAHALITAGVGPDDRVGLYVERSLESVVGMLAILKAGGAYVPLDPAYPEPRLAFMRDDSALTAVVTTSALRSSLADFDRPQILLDVPLKQPVHNPHLTGHGARNLAYVIYTSGSTGQPKGVMVEHRNVVALIINNTYAPLQAQDCVAHCASPSFDAATWEVWAALLNGARLLVVPKSVVIDPLALRDAIVQHEVTAMLLTVGLFNEYADSLAEAFGRLRYLLTGGDALVASICARMIGGRTPPQNLVNCYGPTEATTFATTHTVRNIAPDARSVPIGRPIANTQIYILDDQGRPVPIGAVGEIYIGGAGVARGYLNRPGLTHERFLPDPFARQPGARMYKTGDLGYWRDDGNVEFVGRNDFQVKIRGFRVELGEVEAMLHSCPGVRLAVAAVREAEPGVKRLVGYIVPELPTDGARVDLGQLASRAREYMKANVPQHMVPAIIVALRSLPLNPNGKVDRRALPDPESARELSQNYVAAGTPTEQLLTAIWQECLKVERVGIDDNFFELGGDSLLGIDMISKAAQALSKDLPFIAVMQYPTVRELARFIGQLDTEPAQ